jgi:FkbM family methyltransferase
MPEPHEFSAALGVSVPPITIVDVGAMAEGPDRYASLVDGGMATVVGFEPNPEQYARLTAGARPGRTYLPYCLGKGGSAELYITRYPGCTSLLRPDPRVVDLFRSLSATDPGGNFHVVGREGVVTRRLDDVAECPRPDFLKIDVQGGELDVLAGGVGALVQCLIAECEVEFVPLYENQPLYADIDQFLRAQGFVLHKLINIAGRAMLPFAVEDSPFSPLSQLLWADAVFIRDFMRLEALADDQLLKMACILHEAYRSDDMAYHFLREYDRRTGARTCDGFLPFLRAKGLDIYFMNVCT